MKDLEIVFGDYIAILCAKFKTYLTDESRAGQYAALFDLNYQLEGTDTSRWIKDELTASVGYVQTDFWKREAALSATTMYNAPRDTLDV